MKNPRSLEFWLIRLLKKGRSYSSLAEKLLFSDFYSGSYQNETVLYWG